MKKADKKMADLRFVDYTLRKEKQFGLPDNFSKIDVVIFLSWTSDPMSGFPVAF